VERAAELRAQVAAAAMVRTASLILLIASSVFSLGQSLQPIQTQALDQYITERARSPQMTPVTIAQMTNGINGRLNELENKVLPISVLLNRAMNDLQGRGTELESHLNEIKSGKYNVNPYTDLTWLADVRKDAKKLCCQIKANPAMQKRIQAWATRGATAPSGETIAPSGPGATGMYQRLGNGGGNGGGGGGSFYENMNVGNGGGGAGAGRGGRRGGGGGGGGGHRRGR
jgi:hypothetical protein